MFGSWNSMARWMLGDTQWRKWLFEGCFLPSIRAAFDRVHRSPSRAREQRTANKMPSRRYPGSGKAPHPSRGCMDLALVRATLGH